ncbi:ATP-binding protein [Terrimonas sp. NA20]|uniref:histidine kinase n=1 Tax=Terrimonas ginsenosidimutans TaxID=2908004 RepID=A0ABS9KTY9_9BACT|nr:histidine kinase dimerization/phosphoacceptor domain -containing protein [Terrimonas ginsenosidimutans]MCG2615748.1 ATP-binding protein [Terrimonas ginsenosidimutans]
MKKKICLSLFLLLYVLSAQAQKKRPEQNAETRFAVLMKELGESKDDTNKVYLLVELADYYWRTARANDSIIFYAENARQLARRLKFDKGYNEGTYNLCRIYVRNKMFDKARGLLSNLSTDQQSRLHIVIGENFLFRPALEKHDLDSAYKYFTRALTLANSVRSDRWKHESLIAMGKYYFSAGEFAKAKNSFHQIIADHQRNKDSAAEANIWSELGLYMPDTDSTLADQIEAHGNANKIYRALKDTVKVIETLGNMGGVYIYHAAFDTAKKIHLESLQLRKFAKIKKTFNDTRSLAWIAYAQGNFDESLEYTLDAEKNFREMGGKEDVVVNVILGTIYSENGDHQKSLMHLQKTEGTKLWRFYVARKIAEQYVHLKKPAEGINFINGFEKKYPPVSPADRESIAAAKGDCYAAMRDDLKAERYYLEMMKLDDEAQKLKSREVIVLPVYITGAEAYHKIADFYVSRGRFKAASNYIPKALNTASFSANQFYTQGLIRNLWRLQYKVDSANGDYATALHSYQRFVQLKDSIFDVNKTKQVLNLQVSFETKKKELDIEAKDAQIRAFEQNEKLRQANLQQEKFIRNITLGAAFIFLMLGALAYRQYRQKRKANTLIVSKNDQLHHVLKEKEWLLKEVHHRVKNNLHTIICLLESQATFLQNDALKAIENSQHRVYAMSLIHQKLYQTDNLQSIAMHQYLPEFICYLKDSFDLSQGIVFELNIDPVELEPSKAIPVALILNEAVTNSIKYAFPGSRKGKIRISLRLNQEEVELVVSDNGIGIPNDIKERKLNSLGVELIKGLSEDLNGKIEFENADGTKITLTFRFDSPEGPANRRYQLKESHTLL